MQVRTPGASVRETGDFEVNLAGIDPFAVIELDKHGETQIVIESPEDADRLIKAAVDAKNKILGARALLDKPDDAGLCQYCDVEPAIAGNYCEACAPAVQMAIGAQAVTEDEEPRTVTLPGGFTINFRPSEGTPGWIAELVTPHGTLHAEGYGPTQDAAHAHLNQRLAGREDRS